MKTAAEWVDEIEQHTVKNPVVSLEAAKEQIKDIVEMVQKDAVPPTTPEDTEPPLAA